MICLILALAALSGAQMTLPSTVNSILNSLGSRYQWQGCSAFGGFDLDHTIQCDAQQRVTVLRVTLQGEAGRVPPALSALSALTELVLKNSFAAPTPGFSSTLPDVFGSLTALATLRFEGLSLYGTVPPSLASLSRLTSCVLSSFSAGNRFCCPLPANVPAVCRSTPDVEGGAHLLTCSPFADCDAPRLRADGQDTEQLLRFAGDWVGEVTTRVALARTPMPPPADEAYLDFCTAAPFKRSVRLRVDRDTLKSFVNVLPNGDAAVPRESGLEVIGTFMRDFDNASLVYFDEARGLSGWVHAPSFLPYSKLLLAHCIFVKFENADTMLWWVHGNQLQPDDCHPLLVNAPQQATCQSHDDGTPNARETALGRRRVETETTFYRFVRSGSIFAPPTPAAPASNGGGTVGGGGETDDPLATLDGGAPAPSTTAAASPKSDSVAIIAGGAAVGACIVLAVFGALIFYIIRKRRNESALVVDKNPLYDLSHNSDRGGTRGSLTHTGSATNGGFTGTAQTRSSDFEYNRSPIAMPQTPAGSGASVPAFATRQSRGETKSMFEGVLIDVREVEKGRRVGEGAFGVVYRGRWHGMDVAIKEAIGAREEALGYSYVNINEAELEKFKQEARRMQQITPHVNIVPFYGVIVAPVFSIVCQFCDGGSLDGVLYKDRARDIPMARRWNWLRGIARGAQHLHQEGLVHRDLAARNVLLEHQNDTPMLTDFGMAREGAGADSTGSTKSRVGPVKWMAPEQLTELKYSRFSDVWSFACVCYEVMARRIPYEEDEIPAAIFKIMSKQYLQMPANTPPALLALTQRCWQFDVKLRPSMEQVVAALDAATDAHGTPLGVPRTSLHQSSNLARSSNSGFGTGVIETTPFQCAICGSSYTCQADLDFHHNKRHAGASPRPVEAIY